MTLIRIGKHYVNPEKVSSLEPWLSYPSMPEKPELPMSEPEIRGTLILTDHGTVLVERMEPHQVAELLRGVIVEDKAT